MTDNEIIKALECCGKTELGNLCSGCPKFDKDNDFCQEELHEAALDLINRQQEKIEMLNINLKAMRGAANSFKAEVERLNKEIQITKDAYTMLQTKSEIIKSEAITEIEQWKEEANKYQNLWCIAVHDIEKSKSEAIEEFAERLKCGVPQETSVIRCADIDNLVKEMTEEKRENQEEKR